MTPPRFAGSGNLVAGNIRNGVNIFGVVGNFVGWVDNESSRIDPFQLRTPAYEYVDHDEGIWYYYAMYYNTNLRWTGWSYLNMKITSKISGSHQHGLIAAGRVLTGGELRHSFDFYNIPNTWILTLTFSKRDGVGTIKTGKISISDSKIPSLFPSGIIPVVTSSMPWTVDPNKPIQNMIDTQLWFSKT